MTTKKELKNALQNLLLHVESNTCTHEETHRGGVIWEICSDCGKQWADDEGGKPNFYWPGCVENARDVLDNYSTDKEQQ